MEMIGEPRDEHGVTERRFDVTNDERVVPGIIWTPSDAQGQRPLVLIGHGGSGHKRMPYVLSIARRLARRSGYAVASIDGIGHGDRPGAAAGASRPPGEGIPRSFLASVAEAAEAMTADWTATVSELRELPEVGDGPLGYWGVSMGTMFGLPFLATAPEVSVAVLGLMGTFADDNPWARAAPEVTCPVLFLVQTDDELIPIDAAVALFRSIGSADKRLHAHPGPHAAVPAEEIDASEAFFGRHLA